MWDRCICHLKTTGKPQNERITKIYDIVRYSASLDVLYSVFSEHALWPDSCCNAHHVAGLFIADQARIKQVEVIFRSMQQPSRVSGCSGHTWIDQSYKFHNTPLPYPTIHHIGTEMYTFLFQSGVLWDIWRVHCENCAIVLLTIQ